MRVHGVPVMPEDLDEAARRRATAVREDMLDVLGRLSPLAQTTLYQLLYEVGEERMAGIAAKILRLAREEVRT